MSPVFFFSHSGLDFADEYLERFFGRLRTEVAIQGGIRDVASVGFLDREREAGKPWPRDISDALGSCAVFVPVYSPSYFLSPYCGQEWHAFAGRGHRNAIIPLWWLPPGEPLPAVAHRLQDNRHQFGSEFHDFGLRFLARLTDQRDRYEEFLTRFASQIIAASKDPPPPSQLADLDTLPSAFGAQAAAARNGTRRGGSGPRNVNFVFAAAGHEEMHAIPTSPEKYGEDWRDWRPYHPACADRVTYRTQSAAAAQQLDSSVAGADESLFDLLEKAREQGEVTVIIVDPWIAGLAAYTSLLDKLNRVRSSYAAVVVPWDARQVLDTPEGERARDTLYARIGDWVDGGHLGFRDDIWSMDELESAIGKLVVEIRARILTRRDLVRRVTEPGPVTRPVLAGPGG